MAYSREEIINAWAQLLERAMNCAVDAEDNCVHPRKLAEVLIGMTTLPALPLPPIPVSWSAGGYAPDDFCSMDEPKPPKKRERESVN